MTDQEIVDQANALAREIYTLRGYSVPEGYRFDAATHPHEREAWSAACAAFLMLKETDPNDAVAALEDEETP
jgi:hypothetical protein